MTVDLDAEYAQWLYYYAYCYYTIMLLSFILGIIILTGALKASKQIVLIIFGFFWVSLFFYSGYSSFTYANKLYGDGSSLKALVVSGKINSYYYYSRNAWCYSFEPDSNKNRIYFQLHSNAWNSKMKNLPLKTEIWFAEKSQMPLKILFKESNDSLDIKSF